MTDRRPWALWAALSLAAFGMLEAYALAIILAAYAVQNSGVGRMNAIFANWKTSSFGGGTLMVAVWQLVGMIMGTTPVDPATVGTVVMAVLAGLMGLVAKDGNVTGGTVRQ